MDSPTSRPARALMFPVLLAFTLAVGLPGCGSPGGVRDAVGKTLKAVGLKKEQAPQSRSIELQLHAGDNLNAGEGKRGMALVTRVYQLRDRKRFEQAPFKAFLDPELERIALGDDLIDATEILLTPGKQHEVLEQLPADGRYIGVVALFRAPSTSRWRFAFDANKLDGERITVGLHACAMTTTSAALVTRLATEPHRLSSVNCVAPSR